MRARSPWVVGSGVVVGVDPVLTRRGLLVLGTVAAAGVMGACSGGAAVGPKRIAATNPLVTEVERARRAPGAAVREVAVEARVAEVDLGGPIVRTWTYDGELPGREIRVAKGDVLRVGLRNNLPEQTLVHWHGLALRNDMDGVPGLSQPTIAPGSSFQYEFAVADSGTYWFHPHVGTQLDRGLYAPLIVEDPTEKADYDIELVVVLDDWLDGTGTDPDTVLRGLRGGSAGSHDGHGTAPTTSQNPPASSSAPAGGHGGHHAPRRRPSTGHEATMPMSELLGGHAGDVRYPHFLANGRIAAAPRVMDARAGQRIRLRLINAGGDTAFRVGLPGVTMTVTHTDGFPVVPAPAEMVLLGMGERIDAVFTMPDASLPLIAVAEGRGAHARLDLRVETSATPEVEPLLPELLRRPVLVATDTVAAESVRLSARQPDVVRELKLGGPGKDYTWTINGSTFDPAKGLDVRHGQRVRLVFINETTMFHPMHLHGHTFQVLDGPRKDTVNVLPKRSVSVDFDARNPGQWMTHCHNIYHGEAGMMTVLSYVE